LAAPPSSQQPLGDSYDPSFAPTEVREPTPPLFAPPNGGTEAPESSKTPVTDNAFGPNSAPDSQTDPNAPAPTPSPLPTKSERPGFMSKTHDLDGKTQELSFISQAHCYALSVDEYAAFCAERDACDPAALRRLERRYDVTQISREPVETVFKLRFERDPALRAQWQQAYTRYAAIVSQRQQE
jgi:hypothetical protein